MGRWRSAGYQREKSERGGRRKKILENRQIDGEKKAVFVVAGFVGGASPDGA